MAFFDISAIYSTSCTAPLRSVGRLRRHGSPLSKAPAAPITFPRRLRRIPGASRLQNSRFATVFFLGHTVYMFLRLRRRGIELEEKNGIEIGVEMAEISNENRSKSV